MNASELEPLRPQAEPTISKPKPQNVGWAIGGEKTPVVQNTEGREVGNRQPQIQDIDGKHRSRKA